MCESQRHRDRSLRSVMETQATMIAQQMCLQASQAHDFALVHANQASIIWNLQSLQASNVSLSTQV